MEQEDLIDWNEMTWKNTHTHTHKVFILFYFRKRETSSFSYLMLFFSSFPLCLKNEIVMSILNWFKKTLENFKDLCTDFLTNTTRLPHSQCKYVFKCLIYSFCSVDDVEGDHNEMYVFIYRLWFVCTCTILKYIMQHWYVYIKTI